MWMAIWCRGGRMMTVLILACKTNVIGVYCGVSSRVALPWATWLHGNLAARPRRRASGFFRRPGLVPDGRLVTTLAVAGNRVFAPGGAAPAARRLSPGSLRGERGGRQRQGSWWGSGRTLPHLRLAIMRIERRS